MDSTSKHANPIELLENYRSDTRKMAVLSYEIEHSPYVSPEEIISSMNFVHGDGLGVMTGYISDKTAQIALHYQDKANAINHEAVINLVAALEAMKDERERLHHYISLLDERQREVLRLQYMEGNHKEAIAKAIGVAVRTVDKIREKAEAELVRMYDFAAKHR